MERPKLDNLENMPTMNRRAFIGALLASAVAAGAPLPVLKEPKPEPLTYILHYYVLNKDGTIKSEIPVVEYKHNVLALTMIENFKRITLIEAEA